MEKILEFKDIHFIRDGREILRGVNWTIQEGQTWALVGLNGSGKSSLLGMIPGYTYPSRGEVHVLGAQYGKTRWEGVRDRLGYVSSVQDLFSQTIRSKSCEDVIKSGKGNVHGFYRDLDPGDLARLEDLISAFGLGQVRDKPFRTLSQGEERRTLLARAFMNSPDLMVLDEPCVGLDLRGREDLIRALEAYCQLDKKPLIYVTHNLEEIFPHISHVAIMDQGVLVEKGPKEEVLTQEVLSSLYGLDLEIEKKYGRYWIKVPN